MRQLRCVVIASAFLLPVLLALAPPVGAQLTCDSFTTQLQAQTIFDITQNAALDDDGDGVACESLISDGAQAPGAPTVPTAVAPPTGPDEPTDQELDYFEALTEDMETAGDASLELADLFSAAGVDTSLLFDQAWIIEVATQFAILQQLGIDAQTLEPSSRQQAIHDTWLEINRLLTLAIDEFTFGIDNLDPASLDQGGARFVWATTLLDDLIAAVEAFDADPSAMFERTYPLFPVEVCDEFPDYDVAQEYYAANPEDQVTIDPDFDGLACEVFFERE